MLHTIQCLALGALMGCAIASPGRAATALDAALDAAWGQYSGPPRNMPPRNTVVEFETTFGAFRLPIGYASYPGTLPKTELPPDGSGLHRYDVGMLAFHFTMPDGHQNAAQGWFRPGDDGADRIGIDPRRYAVWITRMDRRPPGYRSVEVTVLDSTMPPDLLANIGNDELSALYKGWTHSPVNHERIGIELACDATNLAPVGAANCLGHIFVKSQNLDLEFLLQLERRDNVFAVAQETMTLLGAWQVTYLK